MSFFVLYYLVSTLAITFLSDFLVVVFFSVFVIEGVIALSGLIILVRFSGTDYVSSNRFIKL
jgi:hypothetical protein